MTAEVPFLPPERRSELIRLHMGIGLSRERANEVVDLAVHATQQASEASARVALAATDPVVAAQTLLLAAQFMSEQCESYVADMVKTAEEAGARVVRSTPV